MAKKKVAYFFDGLSIFKIDLTDDIIGNGKYKTVKLDPLFTTGDTFYSNSILFSANRLDYPTSLYRYSDYVIPIFSEKDKIISHYAIMSLPIEKMFEEDKDKEKYFFDSSPGYFKYSFLFNEIDKKGIKGFQSFPRDLYNLLKLKYKHTKPFIIVNEGTILVEDSDSYYKVHEFERTKALIEKTIRNANYFLVRLPNLEVDKIVKSIFCEMLSNERNNECIIQDALIQISDDDYNLFETEYSKELEDHLNDFFERYPDGFLVDVLIQDNPKEIYKKVLSSFKRDIKYLNVFKIIGILCEYRRLNYSMSKKALSKGFKLPDQYFCANDEIIRRLIFYKSEERSGYRKLLRKIVDNLNAMDFFEIVKSNNIE